MHHPDVTLVDLQMPEMNGIDALIAIRNEFPDARVIVLTTYAGDTQILRALKAGAQAYLLKNALHNGDDPCSPCCKEDSFPRGFVPSRRACD
jgi:DNA-binding NarL/FixJ family response regulator